MYTNTSDIRRLRFAPPYVHTALLSLLSFIFAFGGVLIFSMLSPQPGESGPGVALCANLASAVAQCAIALFNIAALLSAVALIIYILLPDASRITYMMRQALFDPARGNPLHLRDGELLPRIRCKRVGEGRYELIISATAGIPVEVIAKAAPNISAALDRRFQRYAVVAVSSDTACCYVTFTIEDVKIDRSLTFTDVEQMRPDDHTTIKVDKSTNIDLTTSGSMLVAGKTRSGKTTGAASLLNQILLAGPDDFGSEVIIVDPKQAELSRLPHTVTLDKDGEARPILDALKLFLRTTTERQAVLNDLSEQRGDAVKWWDAGMHPSFFFIDEYVALRSIFPKKADKDSDYCLDTFDALVKRIVTTGASAGCFVIISIAEASVQEGGLPAMLRSAMSTRVLFRPTMAEGRLMWDSEKLEQFSGDGRVYGPGDAWFSSTDGVHDAVSVVHFPRMEFPVYRELGRLLNSYYGD